MAPSSARDAGTTATVTLAEAERAARAGELFRAYDLAVQGLAGAPNDLRLKHRAVLSLARAGAIEQAAAKFEALGLDRHMDDLDVAALRARLRKDAALRADGPEERRRLLREAARAYAEAYRRAEAAGDPAAYYPGVNAATLTLLAGDRAAAERIARAVLADLTRPAKLREPGYFELASRIEAHLVLGEAETARALVPAVLAASDDAAARASTVRNLRLVVAARGLDGTWLSDLAPSCVVHYTGHMMAVPGRSQRFPPAAEEAVRARIRRQLAADGVGYGYGSLASGADILFAEELLARAARLDVVLPFRRDEFVDISVRPSGPAWVARFEACLERADSVRYATTDGYLNDDGLFGYCSRLAMGLAVLRARHLGAAVTQIAVWDGRYGRAGPAGTEADMAVWREAGLPQSVVPCGPGAEPESGSGALSAAPARGPRVSERTARAMLFGDLKGFSKLSDAEIPAFVTGVLEPLGRVVRDYGGEIAFANTWGDGLFVVFSDPVIAARCALDLQRAVDGIDRAALGLPPTLALRLGGHYGPVYAAEDPILRRPNVFGAHVSRAARIEPVTPEGCVYVTETFAAALALAGARGFACEYVGMTEAAKGYGAMRMFLLSADPGREAAAWPEAPP